MNRCPQFEIVAVLRQVIAIADCFAFNRGSLAPTVTNGAEAVVDELRDRGMLQGRRLIYRDTDGTWDEILVDSDGLRFAGFAPIRKSTMHEALRELDRQWRTAS